MAKAGRCREQIDLAYLCLLGIAVFKLSLRLLFINRLLFRFLVLERGARGEGRDDWVIYLATPIGSVPPSSEPTSNLAIASPFRRTYPLRSLVEYHLPNEIVWSVVASSR
ncbi:MAG: hypothetical protein RMJ88_07490 [Thermogemmata sp.]|nr:hypothetical protein [Thermogemmata sp.]